MCIFPLTRNSIYYVWLELGLLPFEKLYARIVISECRFQLKYGFMLFLFVNI